MSWTHDTRHHVFSRYFIPHKIIRQVDDGGFWECGFCGCPHIEMPGLLGELYIVAAEAQRCENSFEDECPQCHQVYECRPDCALMETLMELMAEEGYEPEGDDVDEVDD